MVFEIDENDALDRRVAAQAFAAEMRKIGCGILLDGFARRSVSFEPLKALLVNFVKVDARSSVTSRVRAPPRRSSAPSCASAR